jgi:hypothetical protein
MALYEEISLDTLKNILAQDEEEKKRKALENYNTQKTQLDSKYENNGGGLGGFLGSIIGGIGKGIGDVGTGVYDLIGSGVASAKDLIEGKAGTGENLQAFKKDLYKTDSMKDAYAKSAGTALNAATTLATTAVPGLGAGGAAAKALGGVAANTAAGAIGGFADELQQQGENASLESAANRAISGAAGGLIGGKIGSKVGNASSKLGGALLNNKLATSAIGRGAIAGAAGGAAGAGTSAALGGGGVANAALQGAISGAGSGAIQGGVMSAANKLGQTTKNKLGINTEAKTPQQLQNVENRQTKAEDDFMAYGDSNLAKRTKGDQTAEALRRFGNSLEGSQTNVTRAAARDMGIESTGKVVDNVRRKTGLTNLETQAALAKELTGGADSLMDTVQRNALSATEDGSGRFLADQTKVLGEIDAIVDKYATTTALGGEAGVQKLKDQLRADILNPRQDLLSKANNLKGQSQELRGKGIVNPSEGDSAKSKIYAEVAKKIDDLSYSAIPKDNVNDMFDATISEMRARATQARNNGNKDIATAYTKLAESLDKQPRTIQAYRSFKKDFVDVSKINQLTGQAENGAGFQMASGATAGAKRFINRLLERPANAVLAKAGGLVNSIADSMDGRTPTGGGNTSTSTTKTPTQPISQDTLGILTNYIARTEGNAQANNAVQNARSTQEYQNLEDQLSNNVAAIDAEYAPQLQALQAQQLSQSQSQLNQIATAMDLALAAGDVESYNKLASLYQNAYKINELQNPTAESKISTAEKNQLAKLESAGNALDQLESLYNKAGGGQGIVGGNIANFLGSLGVNADVDTYNQLSQGLINQIGAAIGKTDSLNTEGEVQRALQLVPKITDSAETAKNKLASLRALLKQNTNTYSDLYGA